MATSARKMDRVRQIVLLKQVMRRWKNLSLLRRRTDSAAPFSWSSFSLSPPPVPSGCLAVYIGPEKRRFVIPTRFMYFPVFASLLDSAEEEYGFQSQGGLVLPCDVEFFLGVLRLLERDEIRYRGFGLQEFIDAVIDSVPLSSSSPPSSACKGRPPSRLTVFSPLLHKTRA